MLEHISSLSDFVSNLDNFQRQQFLYASVFGGILLAVQLSQAGEPNGFRWTKLTSGTKPYWFTFYVLETLLFVTGAYPMLLGKMHDSFFYFGREQQVLNGIWIGLVGIEVLMVVGTILVTISRAVQGSPKRKTQ